MNLFLFATLIAQLIAQNSISKNDADKFPGVWDLVSIDVYSSGGSTREYWGEHPVGRITYDKQGRMSALLMDEKRNQSDGRTIPADIQAKAAGYYGSYTVDETKKVVTHKVEASIRASESKLLERSYVFKDSTLQLTAKTIIDGKPATVVLLWKRQP